jgi:hypothetical protein
MGRPLSRRMFGPINSSEAPDVNTPPSKDGEDQHGNDLTGNTQEYRQGYNMPVDAARIVGGNTDSADADGKPYIIAQRAARRFIVSTADGNGTCKLVDGESSLEGGEMILKGYVNDAGDGVAIRKISGRKAYDFDSNAYVWYVAADGSSLENRIILNSL